MRTAGVEIVATLGPASFAMARELARAGATSLRLNASHLSPEDLARRAAQAREGAPELPLVVDLQGAKMRVGDIADRAVVVGARVRFAAEPERPPSEYLRRKTRRVTAAAPRAVRGRPAGDHARLRRRPPAFRRSARAARGGWRPRRWSPAFSGPRKGVNLLDHPVRLSGLTPADAARLEAVRDVPRLQVAWSFTLDGREAAWVRERVPGTPVVAKVERREAVEALAEIAARVDAVWVCRGDLGEQLGPGELGRFVGSLAPASSPARC